MSADPTDSGYVPVSTCAQAVSERLDAEVAYPVLDKRLAALFSAEDMEEELVVPLEKRGELVLVAMSDPNDVELADRLSRSTGLRIEPVKADPDEIRAAIAASSAGVDMVSEFVRSSVRGQGDQRLELLDRGDETQAASEDDSERPEAVDLVNRLILQAIRSRSTDVHIECTEEGARARLRMDGELHEILRIPKQLRLPVVSRIKVLAGLDIAEKRVPQDGRIRARLGGRGIDIRVSTLPTFFGEKVVMRLLDRSSIMLDLTDLGFSEEEVAAISELIHRPNGIMLVTGPTGSGKTTTLYSCLSLLNSPAVNISTTEDPVEYQVTGINQTSINVRAGLTFARALRALLRQDPDIVMVGEMRDAETIETAVQAALTGHLVLSTLHTNDAPGAITRLMDMEVEPYLIAGTLIGVIAQRLVKRVCSRCREPDAVPDHVLQRLAEFDVEGVTFHRGKGCGACMGTGYRSRLVLSELLLVTPGVREIIARGPTGDELRIAAESQGMASLRADGVKKAKLGLTTLEEVLAVTTDATTAGGKDG